MKKSNLTLTMQHFGQLSSDERALFLSVISSEKVKEKRAKTKKVASHPYSEEYFYELLKKNHNREVRQRLKKMEKKREKRYSTTG